MSIDNLEVELRSDRQHNDQAHGRRLGNPPKARTTPQPSDAAVRDGLFNAKDLLGLIDSIERDRMIDLDPRTLDQVTRTVRRLAKEDPDALTASLFSLILGTAGELLARCRLVICREIKRETEFGHGDPDIPTKLLEQGWIERFERLAKFSSDMASARARLGHLQDLSARNGQSNESGNREHRCGETVADSEGETDRRETSAAARRKPLRSA